MSIVTKPPEFFFAIIKSNAPDHIKQAAEIFYRNRFLDVVEMGDSGKVTASDLLKWEVEE